MVYAFMADGCEEVEALAVIDLLRRAGEEVELVSIHNKDMTQGSHGIGIKNDVMLKDIFVDAADTLFLPGGGVVTSNLKRAKSFLSCLFHIMQRVAVLQQSVQHRAHLAF